MAVCKQHPKNKKPPIPLSLLLPSLFDAKDAKTSDGAIFSMMEHFDAFFIPHSVTFKCSEPKTAEFLWKVIEDRGSRIDIGFVYFPRDPRRRNPHYYNDNIVKFEYAAITAVELGSPIVHCEVYLGDHVARIVSGDIAGGIGLVQSPSEERDIWELISLPFKNPRKAFELALDIIVVHRRHTPTGSTTARFFEEYFKLNFHPWETLQHFMCRLLVVGHGENDFDASGKDYDEERPGEWTRGVHCSQLVLLFLKRCVRAEALYIPPEHRRRFLSVYSFTCMPSGLNALLKEIWKDSAVCEFRNYVAEPQYWCV